MREVSIDRYILYIYMVLHAYKWKPERDNTFLSVRFAPQRGKGWICWIVVRDFSEGSGF